MAKRKSKKKPPPPRGSAFTRILFTGGVGVLILVVFGFLFARTDGFRSYVGDTLERSTGLAVAIGQSRVTLTGDLLFSDVRTEGAEEEGNPGIQAESIRLDFAPLKAITRGFLQGVRRAEIEGWTVHFGLSEDGQWLPAELSGITTWLGRWGALALPEERRDVRSVDAIRGGEGGPGDDGERAVTLRDAMPALSQTALLLKGGTITWFDAARDVQASVQDASFAMTPLALPTREGTHYHLAVGSVVLPGNQRVRDMDIELLKTGDTYFVLNLEAVRGNAPAGDPASYVPSASRPETEASAAPSTQAEAATRPEVRKPTPDRKSEAENEMLQELIRAELQDALGE